MTRGPADAGYALVAAVASIAVFAIMALALLSSTRGAIVAGSAEIAQAKAVAAADAGVAIALRGLLSEDAASRWSIDGRARQVRFGDATLTIRIEDERGKVPLNLLDEAYVTTLLESVGLDGERLQIARDSMLDWLDDDEEPRLFGAESQYYAQQGLRPRNSALLSVGELGRVRGFDPALVAAIQRIATVNFGGGGFDARNAQPLAIGVMLGSGAGSPAAIQRARELAGQRVAIEFTSDVQLVGRPLTIAVDAALPGDARAGRRVIVELTGAPVRPYVVRAYE